jgi:HK97 family phage portal protein
MGWLETLLGGSDNGPTVRTLEGHDITVSHGDMFRVPIVVACRALLADVTSSFTLYSVDRSGNETNRIPLILEEPSAREPLPDFLERTVNDMTRYGRAWFHVTARDGFDNPLAIDLVSDRRVVATLTSDGQHLGALTIDGRPVSTSDLIQVPMILDDGPLGQSPIVAIKPLVETLLACYHFAREQYGSAGVPNYALMSATRLPPAQAEALMESWKQARSKSRPALLTGDLSLQTFSGQTAADLQLHSMIDLLDQAVARVFQIPPSVVNVLSQSSLTYSTARDEKRQLTASLRVSMLKRIETAFSQLLPPGKFARFDTSGLTRLTEEEQLAHSVTAYQAGLITLAEARDQLGYDQTIEVPVKESPQWTIQQSSPVPPPSSSQTTTPTPS